MPRIEAWLAEARLRIGVVGAALVLATALLISAALGPAAPGGRPTEAAWRRLGVTAMEMDFADLRSITHRWACVRAGEPAYSDGRCDPWGRPFNYPSVWLAPARLGWGSGATRPIAALEIMALFAALWTLFPAASWKGSLTAGVIVLSTPGMFAVERGNVDMLMFSGLVLGLRATRDHPHAAKDDARAALIATLTLLKIFPIAAFAMLARSRSGALKAGVWAVATCAAMMVLYHDTLPLLQRNMAHEFSTNYGRLLLFVTDPAASPWTSPGGVFSLLVAIGVALPAAGLGVLHRGYVKATWGDLLSGEPQSDVAVAGVAIFALTFLLGMNYDYRLIFLALVLPIWLRLDGERWSTPAGAAAAVVMLRLMFAHRCPDRWLAVCDWGLFAAACAWMAAAGWERLVVAPCAPRPECSEPPGISPATI